MNEISEIDNLIKFSGINKLLYTSENITKFAIKTRSLFIIKLNLNHKQISFIERNNTKFIRALISFLSSFNSINDAKYNNITYTHPRINKRLFNNCVILYNSEKHPKSYVFTENFKITLKNSFLNENLEKDEELFLNIIDLIKNKKISVRKLEKLWLKQKVSREIFSYLKEIEVFKISDENKSDKIYNFDNIEKIDKILIKDKVKTCV